MATPTDSEIFRAGYTAGRESQEGEIAELENRVADLEGEGFQSAAEAIQDWWSQSNIQGVAEMNGEEMQELCDGIKQSMREARAQALQESGTDGS